MRRSLLRTQQVNRQKAQQQTLHQTLAAAAAATEAGNHDAAQEASQPQAQSSWLEALAEADAAKPADAIRTPGANTRTSRHGAGAGAGAGSGDSDDWHATAEKPRQQSEAGEQSFARPLFLAGIASEIVAKGSIVRATQQLRRRQVKCV